MEFSTRIFSKFSEQTPTKSTDISYNSLKMVDENNNESPRLLLKLQAFNLANIQYKFIGRYQETLLSRKTNLTK